MFGEYRSPSYTNAHGSWFSNESRRTSDDMRSIILSSEFIRFFSSSIFHPGQYINLFPILFLYVQCLVTFYSSHGHRAFGRRYHTYDALRLQTLAFMYVYSLSYNVMWIHKPFYRKCINNFIIHCSLFASFFSGQWIVHSVDGDRWSKSTTTKAKKNSQLQLGIHIIIIQSCMDSVVPRTNIHFSLQWAAVYFYYHYLLKHILFSRISRSNRNRWEYF